ncbi:MAG: DUF2851 family protein [Verrucomicrobiota bacterium]
MTDEYAAMRATTRVQERALFPSVRTPSELELQARWFAGDFGKQFITASGDKIDIIQFGTWNRESGPDFRDAAISLNDGDPIRGAIEFDLADRNWETHGHAINPAFEDTVLHVFIDKSEREFFTRTKSNREVLQLRVDPNTLSENFSTNIPLARPGRCQAPLKDLPGDRVHNILESAAQFRLHQKAARIRRKIDSHGRDEALFQEIAAALGYKQNQLPFTLLAQRLPLVLLRKEIGNCEALLFGVAGFLQTPDLDVYKKSTRDYVRGLWDWWWPHRDALQRIILPSKLWRLSSSRPLNHPQRRVAALATLVREWPRFQRAMGKTSAVVASDLLQALSHSFWKSHYTLTAAPTPKEMALIGESRVAEISANVLFPFWLAEDGDRGESGPPRTQADLWPDYAKLPARLSNRRLETAATRLFGDDPRRAQFLKTVLHQQGLLQIYEDFCLQDNSDCTQCPFPEQMRKWT